MRRNKKLDAVRPCVGGDFAKDDAINYSDLSHVTPNAVISRRATNLSGKRDQLNPGRLDEFVRPLIGCFIMSFLCMLITTF